MLCEPAAFQAHVTLPPAAIVSTAGFALPLCALRKKIFPTVTWPTGPPPPPPPPPPLPWGEVTPPQAVRESKAAVTIDAMCRMVQLRSRWVLVLHAYGQGLRLAVDEIVHHDEVVGAARAQIGAGRAQGGVAARDQHPGDDRRIEHRSEERKALDAALGGGCDVGDADAVRVEILDARGARPVDVGEDDAEALGETVGRLPRQLEIDLYLIRADGHEQLLGRERLELVCQSRVDRRKSGAVYAESRPGGGHQHSPLRVDVEEGRRAV